MIKYFVNKIYHFYHESSIRAIVFLTFTIAALVALLMMGMTLFWQFSRQLSSNLSNENQSIVEYANRSLNSYLSNMIHLADSVSYGAVRNIDITSPDAGRQLELLYDANSNLIHNITLFSPACQVLATAPAGKPQADLSVADETWFTDALASTENLHFSPPVVEQFFAGTGEPYTWVIPLSCAAEYTEGKTSKTGVVLINLRYSGLADLFNDITLSDGGYIFLADSDGKIIYHPRHQLLAAGLAEEPGTMLAGQSGRHSEGRREIIIRSAGYTGWSVIAVIPLSRLTFDIQQNLLFLLAIMLMYFALLIWVNAFLSEKLTDPVKKLEQSVLDVESGHYPLEIYEGGSHEIQHLGHSIRQMTKLIQKQADDIAEERIHEQKSKLNILQAQINPHFLYNTLDIIVWFIEKQRYPEALQAVSALGRFFRLSLSQGKDMIVVRDELEHVRNYLTIQKMRYKNKFEFYIDAAEETLDKLCVKLVLQPLVENAIYHSIDFMTDNDGEIVISSRLDGDCLCLTVKDNGLGIAPERVPKLLSENATFSKGSGVGLKNVHERITLYFGKEYGVVIHSEPDVGTLVTIRMPVIPGPEKEEPR